MTDACMQTFAAGRELCYALSLERWSGSGSGIDQGKLDQRRELGPRIRRAHIDDADGLDALPQRLGIDQVRRHTRTR